MGIAIYVGISEDRKQWVIDNIWLYFVAMAICFGLLFSLCCCIDKAKKPPLNWFYLCTFTLCLSYMVAGLTSMSESEHVIAAASLTYAMTIGLTLFACCTKMKLNWLFAIGAAISVAIWPLIIMSWFYPETFLSNVIALIGVVFSSMYIVKDTKMIMSEKGGFTTDDYVVAALKLYADVILLFIWLLYLFGGDDDKDKKRRK